MYTLEDVYKTFPSGCTEDYKILRAFEMGKQTREKQIRALQKQNGELTDELNSLRKSIKDYGAGCYENGLRNGRRKLEAQIEKMKCCGNCQKLRGRFDSKTNINILYCSDSDMKQIEVGFQMCCCKWEIKEK